MAKVETMLAAALAVVACHDVTQRERRVSPAGADGGEGGSAAIEEGAASGASAVSGGGSRTPSGGAANADGSSPLQAPPLGEGGAAGSDHTEPSCSAGLDCTSVDECWVGTTVCEGPNTVCSRKEPAPARTPCGIDGECTGDGTCIKRVTSCARPEQPGCGHVTIAGGAFLMGWSRAAADHEGEPVEVDAFVIDAFEVTVARFRDFWAARPALIRRVTYPNGAELSVETAPREPEPRAQHESYNWTATPESREHHPINRVTWDTAFLFCAWDGGRLPTEAEWEYVATGREVSGLTAGRRFPWGDAAHDCTLANTLDCGISTTVPVDRFVGWGGVHQLAGNVTEWTADEWCPLPGDYWTGVPRRNPLCLADGGGFHPAKGGSFASSAENATGVSRLKSDYPANARGVRCVRDIIRGGAAPSELTK